MIHSTGFSSQHLALVDVSHCRPVPPRTTSNFDPSQISLPGAPPSFKTPCMFKIPESNICKYTTCPLASDAIHRLWPRFDVTLCATRLRASPKISPTGQDADSLPQSSSLIAKTNLARSRDLMPGVLPPPA